VVAATLSSEKIGLFYFAGSDSHSFCELDGDFESGVEMSNVKIEESIEASVMFLSTISDEDCDYTISNLKVTAALTCESSSSSLPHAFISLE